ncbi:Ser-Thr-rich glycosyl-phosphatidyl-inositol-anchored membrane family-domain-containing protein [Xylariaceae sp. FL0255]|nr:Ser-Thr-rich glycosyl-phosphatidyl-inositol-anchored membrane family-domain-containing protein [Xylariaceae sp. FL0255]
MRSALAILALAASVLAQTPGYAVMSTPADNEVVPAGETYTVKWAPGMYSGAATLSLLGGTSPSTLQILNTIATIHVQDGSYAWHVDCSLGEDKTYGLKIASSADDGKTFQYSFPFSIKGCTKDTTTSTTASSSSAPATTTTTTTIPTGYPVSQNATVTSITASSTVTKASSTITSSTTGMTTGTTTGTTTATTLVTTSSVAVTVPPTGTKTTGTSPTSSVPATSSLPATGGAAAVRTGAGLAAVGFLAAALAL